RRSHALTDKDTIVIADFTNTTGDPEFDDTLKQALTIGLEQSPFFNIISNQRIHETLREMMLPPGERLTSDVTREVCQRTGSKAYLNGSITPLGTKYVIGLVALKCTTGDEFAQTQVTAVNKEQVLAALGEVAIKFRKELGESLSSMQRFDVPIYEATTK